MRLGSALLTNIVCAAKGLSAHSIRLNCGKYGNVETLPEMRGSRGRERVLSRVRAHEDPKFGTAFSSHSVPAYSPPPPPGPTRCEQQHLAASGLSSPTAASSWPYSCAQDLSRRPCAPFSVGEPEGGSLCIFPCLLSRFAHLKNQDAGGLKRKSQFLLFFPG